MFRLALFSLMALAMPASAQIYQYTDANGRTVFSDQPPAQGQAKTIALNPINTVPKQAMTEPEPSRSAQSSQPYEVLRLGVPADGGAIRANNGDFTVNIEITPPLRGHHYLRLLLDGAPYGTLSREPLFQLTNLDRGEHSLAVEVLSGNRSVQQSETARFTVQRVHK